MVLRYCVIGSMVFHMIILCGVGFCLPQLTVPEPSEKYFEVDAPSAFSAQSGGGTAMTENRAKPGMAMMVKHNQAPFQPSQPIKNSEPSDWVSLNDHNQKAPEVTGELFQISSPNEAPVSSKNIQNQAGFLSGVFSSLGGSGVPGGSGSDAAGSVGNEYAPNGKPGGNASGSPFGVALNLPAPEVRAVKVYSPNPEYPWKAKQNNWEGTVVFMVDVLQNGRVGEIKIVTSSGYKILDTAALKAIKTWRYKPALENGKPVLDAIEITIHFRQLEG